MQGSPRIGELRQKFHENPRRYFAPLANEYRKAGDPEQAIAICRAHLAQQPGHMSGHVVYGQALYDARRMDEAQTVLEKALSLDPDNAVVLRYLGNIARERGDAADARHWYGRALDLDPQDTGLAAYLAELTENAEPQHAGNAEAQGAEPSAGDAGEEEIGAASADEVAAESVGDVAAEQVVEIAAEAVELAESFTDPVVRELVKDAEPEPVAGVALDEHPEIAAAEPDPDDVIWRKTPQAEDSPFVTRTMAELYAQQGHHEAALEVFRQLALQHPDDSGIRDRIDELSRGPAEPADSALEDVLPPADEMAPSSESAELFDDSSADGFAGFVPGELAIEPGGTGGRHFTEIDLDWNEGTEERPESAEEEQGGAEEGLRGAEEGQKGAEEERETLDGGQTIGDGEGAIAESDELIEQPAADTGVVAYSPEPPPEDQLQRFVPRPVTIREFFAALGARKPPLPDSAQSFTARAAIPEVGAVSESAAEVERDVDDLPFATDAFAELFPDSSVSEEDARAAFALSGALAATQHSPAPSSVLTSPPREEVPPEASEPALESEDELRRFREWLDGLSES